MSDVAVTLSAAAPVPVVTLSPTADVAGIALVDSANQALTLASPSVQIALQAFMRGAVGPIGLTPVITLTAHAISSDAQPTVLQSGTTLAPAFDIGVPSGATFNLDEFIAQTSGAITRTYATTPSPSTKVFINGLRQASTEFTISGDEVLLSGDLQIEADDFVQIDY